MPYLDQLRSELQLEGGDVITEDWYRDLVKYLELIEKEGAVDYAGYVHKDLIPETDALLNLGVKDFRFREVHSAYGYINYTYGDVAFFTNNVYVQGKRVIKDEDPIKISEFFDYAKRQIEDAVFNAIGKYAAPKTLEREIGEFYAKAYQQIIDAIETAIRNIGIPVKPKIIDYVVDYYAYAGVDIFLNNLVVPESGRIRIKAIGDKDFYGYLKHKLAGTPIEVIGLINEGNPIKANTWKEEDYTVSKNDEINVRVFPSTRITIVIYNIPEA